MSEISSRIDNLLTQNNLKRADLVRGTGISEGTIRGWIKGQIPSAEAAYKVAKYFNVTVEWLITGKPENENKNLILSKSENELIEIFRKLDARDQQTLLNLASSMEKQYCAPMDQSNTSG